MGILDETRFIERLQFFNGQRLFADDLQGIEAFNREMRWLHNRSLHQPGIGNGYAVAGKKGDRQVSIQPGYAIDALGREIVLNEAQIEPVPPVAGEDDGQSVFYDLTVAYPADSDLEEAETRAGICLPRGVVRLREAPLFCWVRLERDERNTLRARNPLLGEQIKNGMMIVLARAEVLNCQLNQDLIIAQRRSARPSRQPYVACGSADPTDWKPWLIGQEPASPDPGLLQPAATTGQASISIAPVGLTADIDTSSGGFLTVPGYSARIEGPRIKTLDNGHGQMIPLIVDGLINIANAGPKGFTVYVLLIGQLLLDGGGGGGLRAALAGVAERAMADAEQDAFLQLFADWSVIWMGVEG